MSAQVASWKPALAAFALLGAAVVPAVAVDITGGVANVAPTLVSLTLGSTSLTPTAGTTTSLSVTTVVSDLNGYNDVAGVQVSILKPDGSVHLAAAAATFSSGTGVQATYTKSLAMNYYDAPALLTDKYRVKVTATDAQGAAVDSLASLGLFNYAELVAASTPSSLDLGASLAPGDASSIGSLRMSNSGNVQIDLQVSGTAPSNSGTTIPVSSIRYSLNSDLSSSSALSTSAASLGTFDLGAGSGSSRDLYWRLTLPSGSDQYVPAGTYTSTVTITAVAG